MAGLMVGAACVYAQPPQGQQGGRPQMPPVLNPEEKTAQMAEQYGLNDEQKQALLELNTLYDGKLEFRAPDMGEQRDIRSMTEAERHEFFNKMMEQMGDMQDRMDQMEKDQKEYDKAIKEIFTKDQLKAYKKEQRKRQLEMQRRQQQGFGGPGGPGGFPGGGPGGFGGPGGGFGGPGGGFGGPGGF